MARERLVWVKGASKNWCRRAQQWTQLSFDQVRQGDKVEWQGQCLSWSVCGARARRSVGGGVGCMLWGTNSATYLRISCGKYGRIGMKEGTREGEGLVKVPMGFAEGVVGARVKRWTKNQMR
ncbi:hypothetical protein VNO78_02789 [Psophocarpus tetragonolobus]|uniref:Uncharacterized protein n=1 Tax=Psophocarpus tetragonolobus TaxID=3891 RepID=A0AAN9TBF8_PSOTE